MKKVKFSVIPEPEFFEVSGEGTFFNLGSAVCFEGAEETEKCIRDLVRFIEETMQIPVAGGGREKIRLEISKVGQSEGYTLLVRENQIILTGNDEKGLFYAVQTLKQLFACNEGRLPGILIKDRPRFPVRGFMLDCGRYFFTVEAVKQFLDMMALHKLNEFHWHLSEDQGFRCCIESKLLLTEIGSYRSHTNFNSKPHEGYYTKAQMKEIISYAHERHIRVIPEIDSPGHVTAMLAAYPKLACFERDFTVSTFWGVRHDVLCVGKESTFEFMQELYDELTEIFTDGVIHLGGDEVPVNRWKICPECQRRMNEEGFTDESQLHIYYLGRIADYLRKKGLEVRVWNDCQVKNGLDKAVTVQLWNGAMKNEDVVAELNSGRKFVLSCTDRYYLDLPYAHTNLAQCYNFEPAFDGLDSEGEKNLLGIEGCLWTEFVPDMLTADRMTYPRLGAISESAWSPKEKKDFSAFLEKMPAYYALLGMMGVSPSPLKRTMPKGAEKLLGKLYWERRKLCWGAHINIIADLKAKKLAQTGNSDA